jgi:hypothetical protein
MDIKDLIIFLLVFIAVLWLQNNDDKKFNKPDRTALFDKIKLPLFIAVCILLIKNLNNDNNFLNFINQTKSNVGLIPPVNLQSPNFNDIILEQFDS